MKYKHQLLIFFVCSAFAGLVKILLGFELCVTCMLGLIWASILTSNK